MESRRGIGLGDLIILLVIVVVVALLVLTSLPRSREAARLSGCRRNLGEIGEALARFETVQNQLPRIPALGPEPPSPMSGPLAQMLRILDVNNFAGFMDPAQAGSKRPQAPNKPVMIVGFLCPTDLAPRQVADSLAPVNYRATTGDAADGTGGAFAPGRPPLRFQEIEAADGLAYTVAFAERLRGTGRAEAQRANYAQVAGPLGEAPCPTASPDSWRGDAGTLWTEANWTSTLYNHAMIPNEQPSCLAHDGRTARIGASSSHQEGVNILKFDLSVMTISGRIDRELWQRMARFEDDAPQAEPSVPDASETNPRANLGG